MTKTAEELLFESQDILAAYLESEGAMTAEACIEQLLGILESPDAIMLAVNAGRRGPVDEPEVEAALEAVADRSN